MPQTKVLITFYSRSGSTEKLALAAAVGAVQSRALIRLRRLPDMPDMNETVEGEDTARGEELTRMRKEYVPPAEADVLWADGLVFGTPENCSPSGATWGEFLGLLARMQSQGSLDGKVSIVVSQSAAPEFSAAVLALGLAAAPLETSAIPDAVDRALLQGRSVAAACGTGKTSKI